MISLRAWIYLGACIFCLLPSSTYSISRDYKVCITNNGPTTVGGITTFDATVVAGNPQFKKNGDDNETVSYTFWWKPEEKWIKHETVLHGWDSFKCQWTETAGNKTVHVWVEIVVEIGDHKQEYRSENSTKVVVTDNIIASLAVTQDSVATYQREKEDDFTNGLMNFEVLIHDPSHLFQASKIVCDWDFGDGTWLNNSNIKHLKHNYTEDIGKYTVTVKLQGSTLGRNYTGIASKTLKFTANFDPYLVIKSLPGPKLPPLHRNKTLIPVGTVTFELKFTDRYHLITGVSTDWRFDQDHHIVRDWKNTTISHTYKKEEIAILWVTVRIATKHHEIHSLLQHRLHVIEPVNSLNVSYLHFHPKENVVGFNISCNGSVPVSFCWLVSKSCHPPSDDICSPTLIQMHSCCLLVNHTFHDTGKYCLHVRVINQVSGRNTSVMVMIPDPIGEQHHSSKSISLQLILVAFLTCCLLTVLLLIIIRNVISRRHKATEKADFDFRDEGKASFSTMSSARDSCFPKCSCSREQAEEVPLLSQAANSNCSRGCFFSCNSSHTMSL